MDFRIIIGIVSAILAVVAFVPYIRDIIKEQTKPHIFTWLIWTLTISISAAIQIYGGAGTGSWTTIGGALTAFLVLIFSFKNGSKNITHQDIIFFILAIISLLLWLIVHQPMWSAILILLTELLGFIPTVRKSWHEPKSETLFTWKINALRYGLSIIALTQFNILTLLYPITWTIINISFSIMLLVRRKK